MVSENLLRPLSSLYGHQQCQLVRDLARGKDGKPSASVFRKRRTGSTWRQILNMFRNCQRRCFGDLHQHLRGTSPSGQAQNKRFRDDSDQQAGLGSSYTLSFAISSVVVRNGRRRWKDDSRILHASFWRSPAKRSTRHLIPARVSESDGLRR